MNAPPGVDTDTSGEDFTPPPTPPPDRTRPQFSLTSLLTATPRPRKSQRKAAAKVKHQTPIEAADDVAKQKVAKLKKKVRIADTEQADEAVVPASDECSIPIPESQAVIDQGPTSESSRDVIGLLNRLLAQNDEVDAEDADSELSIGSPDGPQPDSDSSQIDHVLDPGPEVNLAAPEDQLITSLKPRRQLRKRTRLKLLPTWLRSKKAAIDLTVSSPEDPPTPTAFPPGLVPSSGPSQSDIAAPVGQTTPWTAPLPPPAGSPYIPQISRPETAHPLGGYALQNPSTTPNWSVHHPYDTLPSDYPRRLDPTAAWEGMPNPPPWLWTGHHADHLPGQAAIVAPSHHPPFPPFYPHPASLQPWNPWYPSQHPTGSPTAHYPHNNPYDGIRETGLIQPGNRGTTPPSNPQNPGTGADTQHHSVSDGVRGTGGVWNESNDEPALRSSSGSAIGSELVDAQSLMSSVHPVVETAHPPDLKRDLTRRSKATTRPTVSVLDRMKRSPSPTMRKPKQRDESHQGHHQGKDRQGLGKPPDAHQEDASAPGSSSKTRQSEGSDGSRRGHHRSSTTALALDSQSRDDQSKNNQMRHELHAPRSPPLERGSTQNRGKEEQQDTGVLPQPGSGALQNPSWSECLLSMAVCINLVNTVLDKTRKRSTSTSSIKSRKDVSIGLLTSIVSSLIVQRSLAGALRDTLDQEHPTTIDTFVQEMHTLINFLRHRATKAGLSDKDVRQLSRLHKRASDSFQSAGTTLLLSHMGELSFLATPKAISAILELGSDWYKGELSGKKVVSTAMLIRHELKTSRQGTQKGMNGDEDGKVGWSASALTHGIDLLCKIFDPDGDHDGKQSTTGTAKSNTKALEEAQSQSSRRDDQDQTTEDHAKTKKMDKQQEHSHHRSPMTVLSDLMHTKPDADKDDARATRATLNGKSKHETVQHSKDPKKIIGPESDKRTEAQLVRPSTKSGRRESHMAVIRPNPPIAQSALSRDSKHKPRELESGKESEIGDPVSGMWSYPDSSPSIYSQDDMDSEGTVESDEEARELLARANSGPTRKQTEGTGTPNIEERQPTEEQVNRAKKVVFGGKVPK